MLLRHKIRMLRESRNLSQKKLGKACGATSSHISLIESGNRTRLYFSSACRIARALGISLDELIKDTEFDGGEPLE